MRSVSSAIWTSVEPVSLVALAELARRAPACAPAVSVMRRGNRSRHAPRQSATLARRSTSRCICSTSASTESKRRSPRRRSRNSIRSVCAVEVAVEVDQVGLDEHAAAGLERRAHADVDRRARPAPSRRAARVDAVARARRAPRRGRGWRSGSRARGRARRRGRPRRAAGTGAPRKRAACSTSPASTRPRMWLEETISPSTSTSGTTRVSKRASARSSAGVALRAVAEAEVLAHRDLRRRRARSTSTSVDELLARLRCAKAPSNGITTSSSTPSAGDQLGLALERRSAASARASGATTASGCGSKVSTVSAPRDHLAVAEVDAVELADRDAARARLDVGSEVSRSSYHQPRKPTMGLSVPSARGSATAIRPSRVGQAHGAGAALGARRAAVRDGHAVRQRGARRRRRAHLGQEAERVVERDEPLRIGVGDVERPDRGAPQLARSRRRRGRRSASARRCPTSTRSRSARAVALAPELLEARRPSTSRSGISTSSPRARPLVGALAADLDRRVGRRALARSRRSAASSGVRRHAPGLAISPSGSPVVEIAAEPRDRHVGLRQRHEEALHARGPADEHEQQAGGERVERAGVADLRRPCRAARRTAATTSCEVTPAGLSTAG